MQAIIAKIEAGERINAGNSCAWNAKRICINWVFSLMASAALHRPVVTYVIDRNINYTDICISACKFCAFFKAPEDATGQVLSRELAEKIRETQALGGTQILLQGGLHPDKPLEFYEDMLRFMKSTGIHIHGFSPPEVDHFAQISGLSITAVLERLIAAGLNSHSRWWSRNPQ